MTRSMDTLPDGYQETLHVRIMDDNFTATLSRLSLWSLIAGCAVAGLALAAISNPRESPPDNTALSIVAWALLIGTFFIHEWLHGVAIRWAGQVPRYGVLMQKVGRMNLPLALYATVDGALFRRDVFVIIALAPLTVITLGCVALMWFLPNSAHLPLALMIIANTTGAVGDMWMTYTVMRYPREALVMDEADGIRVFTVQPGDNGVTTHDDNNSTIVEADQGRQDLP